MKKTARAAFDGALPDAVEPSRADANSATVLACDERDADRVVPCPSVTGSVCDMLGRDQQPQPPEVFESRVGSLLTVVRLHSAMPPDRCMELDLPALKRIAAVPGFGSEWARLPINATFREQQACLEADLDRIYCTDRPMECFLKVASLQRQSLDDS